MVSFVFASLTKWHHHHIIIVFGGYANRICIQAFFFFFPPVSKRVFNTLHCYNVAPGESYMWADLSLRCWDNSTHNYWVLFALGAMPAGTRGPEAASVH